MPTAQEILNTEVSLGYQRLSPRLVKEAKLASAASGTQMTAQAAITYAAEQGYTKLSDLALDQALLAALA